MQEIGISSRKAIPITSSILLALTHMKFALDDRRQAPFIKMRSFKSEKTSRDDGIEVEVDEALLPEYVFQKKQGKRFLVPVPISKVYVSSSKYHACEFVLMMLLLNEFCEQSMSLASQGCIQLTTIELNNLFRRAGFSPKTANNIRRKWAEDKSSAFLINIHTDHYVLGPKYESENRFLIEQGYRRLKGRSRRRGTI